MNKNKGLLRDIIYQKYFILKFRRVRTAVTWVAFYKVKLWADAISFERVFDSYDSLYTFKKTFILVM